MGTTSNGKAVPMEVISTSRLLDCIGSKEEWQRQSGYSMADAALGACRELVDNSLDACEEAGVPPVVSVKLDDTGLEVADNGRGMDVDTIRTLTDFGLRASSRAGRCAPSRGQQGNGFQACLALPYVLNGNVGRVDISSRGIRHELALSLNRVAQQPHCSVEQFDCAVQIGTSVKLWVPAETMVPDDDQKARFVSFVGRYAWVNRHLTLHIDCFGERYDIPATDPDWKKFQPADPVPPRWYDATAFSNRVLALIGHDLAAGQDRLVRDYLSQEFRGLKRTTARAAVLETAELKGQRLSSLLNGHGLREDATARLWEAVLQRGNDLPNSHKLGLIGEEHLRTCMAAACCNLDTFVYRRSRKDAEDDGKPFVVEMAFAEMMKDTEALFVYGVNHSAMIGDPFDNFYPHSCCIHEGSPVTLFVHVGRPAIQSTDRGKAHVVLGATIEKVMDELLAKVAGEWRKKVLRNRRANEADKRAEQRARIAEPKREEHQQKRRLRDVIFELLRDAIVEYRATLGDVIWERQLFYNIRNKVQQIDRHLAKFSQATFKRILNDYQELFGEIEGLSNKPRGTFVEPHGDKRLPLGTRDVAQYVIPSYQYDKILVIEKQGFEELFNRHQIAQRYDLGIMYDEGYSVDAGKALAKAAQDRGIKLFLLHDTDPYGYQIFDAMRRASNEAPDGLDIIDISFTMEDALVMGKVPEVHYRPKALAQCILPLLTPKTLEVFQGERVPTPPEVQKRFKKHHPYVWEYGRVELNDFATDPAEFMAEIEKRLKTHGADKKLVPPRTVLKHKAIEERDSQLRDAASWAIHDALDIDAMVRSLVEKLKRKVRLIDIPKDLQKWAKELRPQSWKQRITEIVCERIDELADQVNELAEEAIENR
jgi:DNA topoisomerase VI subunit B